MEDSIVDLVGKTLVKPDLNSPYFPKTKNETTRQIMSDVLQRDRAKGFLIIVNSFKGENSDANKVLRLLQQAPYSKEIEIILLSGDIVRNNKREFDNRLKKIIEEGRKFVIIATSVVEMGVTFKKLDFIATMDSGFDQTTIGETDMAEIGELGTNALKQRIGRVGREQCGIGYITKEVGAPYTKLSDHDLNNGGLAYEPIRLPMLKGQLTALAMYSFAKRWKNIEKDLEELDLPSRIHLIPERVAQLKKQRQRLIDLGIALDDGLTPGGEACDRWIGVSEVAYAIAIQNALLAKEKTEVLFYLVAAAMSEARLSNFFDRDETRAYKKFAPGVNINGEEPRKRYGVMLRGQELEFCPQSELITFYNLIRYFINQYGKVILGGEMNSLEKSVFKKALVEDATVLGFDREQIEKVLKGFNEVLRTFSETNNRKWQYKNLFGEERTLKLTDINFPPLHEFTIRKLIKEVSQLPGRTKIVLHVKGDEDAIKGFDWSEENGEKTGFIYANATAVAMTDGTILNARLVPERGRGDIKAGSSWKALHPQLEFSPEVTTQDDESEEYEEDYDDE